ncbi:Epsin-3, clathrin recruitment and traffic between the Golgi and endosome [Stygiomarasmius scandens]|uniref:Epsin-3, clathrin recruitment and traffic between the Golgi and endosome n=1 Tax=Marasmiellus scandens TaxID=2682957 RepID=A0ABR1IUU3_9AGAR
MYEQRDIRKLRMTILGFLFQWSAYSVCRGASSTLMQDIANRGPSTSTWIDSTVLPYFLSPDFNEIVPIIYSGSSGYGNERFSYSASGSEFRDSSERRDFEEYDAGDKPVSSPTATSSRSNVRSSTSTSGRSVPQRKPTAPLPPPEPVKEVDLLGGFDDDAFGAPAPAPAQNTNKDLPAVGQSNQNVLDDDDFADFQAAPSMPAANTTTTNTAPLGGQKMNLMEMLNSMPAPTRSQSMGMGGMQSGMGMGGMQPMGMQGTGGSMGSMSGGMGMHRSNTSLSMGMGMQPMQANSSLPSSPMQTQRPMSAMGMGMGMGAGMTATTAAASAASAAKPKPTSNFDDLWSMGLGTVRSGAPSTPGGTSQAKSMKDLGKEKASAGLWGAMGGSGNSGAKQPVMGSGMGSFGASSGGSASGGGDDLLL